MDTRTDEARRKLENLTKQVLTRRSFDNGSYELGYRKGYKDARLFLEAKIVEFLKKFEDER